MITLLCKLICSQLFSFLPACVWGQKNMKPIEKQGRGRDGTDEPPKQIRKEVKASEREWEERGRAVARLVGRDRPARVPHRRGQALSSSPQRPGSWNNLSSSVANFNSSRSWTGGNTFTVFLQQHFYEKVYIFSADMKTYNKDTTLSNPFSFYPTLFPSQWERPAALPPSPKHQLESRTDCPDRTAHVSRGSGPWALPAGHRSERDGLSWLVTAPLLAARGPAVPLQHPTSRAVQLVLPFVLAWLLGCPPTSEEASGVCRGDGFAGRSLPALLSPWPKQPGKGQH